MPASTFTGCARMHLKLVFLLSFCPRPLFFLAPSSDQTCSGLYFKFLSYPSLGNTQPRGVLKKHWSSSLRVSLRLTFSPPFLAFGITCPAPYAPYSVPMPGRLLRTGLHLQCWGLGAYKLVLGPCQCIKIGAVRRPHSLPFQKRRYLLACAVSEDRFPRPRPLACYFHECFWWGTIALTGLAEDPV